MHIILAIKEMYPVLAKDSIRGWKIKVNNEIQI